MAEAGKTLDEICVVANKIASTVGKSYITRASGLSAGFKVDVNECFCFVLER